VHLLVSEQCIGNNYNTSGSIHYLLSGRLFHRRQSAWWFDHSPPTSAQVKTEQSYNITVRCRYINVIRWWWCSQFYGVDLRRLPFTGMWHRAEW